jgi:hypothetical protein
MSKRKSTRRAKSPVAAKPTTKRAAASVPIRIARVAKGKKPQYFSDPAIDKLLWMTTSLMEELSVTRDRLDTVERLLDHKRVVRLGDINGYKPSGAALSERDARRAAFVARVLRVVQAELEELTRPDMPKSADEVLAAVAE